MDRQALATVLNLVIWLPVAGAVVIALLPSDSERSARWVALAVSAAALAGSAVLVAAFLGAAPAPPAVPFGGAVIDPQFATRIAWIPALGASYFVGLDGLSLPMVTLNALLVFLAVL